ncbi:MAG: ribosome-associated translation inhibitor RaiA [Pseudomonadota bacterium]
MHIKIAGRHVDLGEALQERIESSLEGAVRKYFDRPGDAHVTVSKSGHLFEVDMNVHLDSGIILQSVGEADDVYAALDAGLAKIEKRVRRYKRRLRDHHRPDRDPLPVETASSFILAPIPDEDDAGQDVPNGADQAPLTVAEGNAQIRTMTVSEAVMQLELGDTPALMFRNARHDGLNMVYRRSDGHIGWVDPANSEQTSN